MLKKVPFMLALLNKNSAHPIQLLDLGRVLDLILTHGSDIEASWKNMCMQKRYSLIRAELDDALSHPVFASKQNELGTWAFLGPIDIIDADNRFVMLVRCSNPKQLRGFKPTLTLRNLLNATHDERRLEEAVLPSDWPEDKIFDTYTHPDECD